RVRPRRIWAEHWVRPTWETGSLRYSAPDAPVGSKSITTTGVITMDYAASAPTRRGIAAPEKGQASIMGTQGHETDVVFLSGRRTPFGTFGGTLKDFTATDLGVHAAKAALESAGVAPGQVDQVVFGNALQTSADAIYLARHVGLR